MKSIETVLVANRGEIAVRVMGTAKAMGLKTGVDIDALVAVREIVAAGLPNEPLLGAIAKAGVPKGFIGANAAA